MPNESRFDAKIIAHRQGRRSSTTTMSFTVPSSLEFAILFLSERKGNVERRNVYTRNVSLDREF
jgi:hypothetical protein